ncbi:MAG: VOC family protein [Woeseiaceae bacterium]
MAKSYMGAVGIPVTDLDASAAFFTSILGMVELQTIEIDVMKQVVLGFEGVRGPSVLLMSYTDGRDVDCKDNPMKLVFYVPDIVAAVETARSADYSIDTEPTPVAALGGALVAFVKDPDGYRIELVQKAPKK